MVKRSTAAVDVPHPRGIGAVSTLLTSTSSAGASDRVGANEKANSNRRLAFMAEVEAAISSFSSIFLLNYIY